jgi:DNA-binding transcriptional MocR family regulator
MRKHALLVKPKFDLVQDWLSKLNYGDWTKPTGGYFVSFNSPPGLAKEIISLADKAGLKLTKAGSAFPYGVDPEDKNIRIAPTACSLEEVNIAMELFVICTALATLNSSSS